MRVSYDQLIFDETTDAATLNNVTFTGTAFKLSTEGVLLSECEYVDGYLEGVSKDFFPTGRLWREAQMRNDLLHGEERVYDEEGRLREWTRASDGVIEQSKSWDESGVINRVFPDRESTLSENLAGGP